MSDSTLNTAYLNGCLDRWHAGDLEGRDLLVRSAVNCLEPLTRKMLKSFPNVHCWEQTDDVLHNALMRLLRSLESIRPASTRDFVNLAAVNIRRELLDLARHYRNKVGQPTGDDAGSEVNPLMQVAASSESTAELDQWSAFHQAVEKLPDEDRELANLLFYHGWPKTQIAEELGVSTKTIERRWNAITAKLHRMIHDSES